MEYFHSKVLIKKENSKKKLRKNNFSLNGVYVGLGNKHKKFDELAIQKRVWGGWISLFEIQKHVWVVGCVWVCLCVCECVGVTMYVCLRYGVFVWTFAILFLSDSFHIFKIQVQLFFLLCFVKKTKIKSVFAPSAFLLSSLSVDAIQNIYQFTRN